MLIRNPAGAKSEVDEPQQVASRRMPRFGVAIFDNPKDPVGGWACLPDQEAFRFRQTSDLRNDCIWICSVDGTEYRLRMAKLHHLRPAEYFRANLKHIAADLGLHIDGEGRLGDVATVAAPKLAKVLHRTASIAAQVYGWGDPQQILRSMHLHEDIRKTMVMPPPVRNFMASPLVSAYQSYSSPDWIDQFEPDSIVVTLRLNRLTHAKKIMLTPVPDGAWTYTDSGLDLKAVLNPERPSLVEASVETAGMDPGLSTLVAFGAQAGKRNALRSWMCQRELQWVSKFANVTVIRAYVASGSIVLPERLQLPQALSADPMFELSLSAGIVAQCHWHAFCDPIYNSKSVEKKEVSPWGVWLRAADRAMSFDLAMAAYTKQFHVLGYGGGSVVIRLQRSRLPELLDFAMENEVAHPVFREIFEQNGFIK
jgi:hypothetical protein